MLCPTEGSIPTLAVSEDHVPVCVDTKVCLYTCGRSISIAIIPTQAVSPLWDVAYMFPLVILVDELYCISSHFLTIPAVDAVFPYPVIRLLGLVWRPKFVQPVGIPAFVFCVHTAVWPMTAERAPIQVGVAWHTLTSFEPIQSRLQWKEYSREQQQRYMTIKRATTTTGTATTNTSSNNTNSDDDDNKNKNSISNYSYNKETIRTAYMTTATTRTSATATAVTVTTTTTARNMTTATTTTTRTILATTAQQQQQY